MPVMGKSKKEVVAEFRTAEILEAARKVFAEKGFHEATVDDIAAAAGVAKGTVYLYYRSKREIYVAALEHGMRALYREIKQAMDAEETIAGKIQAFIAIKMAYFARHHDFFKIYYQEFGNTLIHPAALHKHFKDLYVQQARMLESVFQDASKRKALRNVRPEAAAFAISDLTRGMITQRLLGLSKADVADDITFIFDLVWKGIGRT